MCGHHRHHRHDHAAPGRTSTVPVDDMRASDAEREEVIGDLRTHAGEGRLTVEELSERIDRAHAARTRRDLAALVADLPRVRRAPRPRDVRAEFAGHLRSYLWVMALLVAIWALSGMGPFWPAWPAAIWGLVLLAQASGALRPRARRLGPG
jgi:hypothetical protein